MGVSRGRSSAARKSARRSARRRPHQRSLTRTSVALASHSAGFAFDFSLYEDPNSREWDEFRRAKWYKRDLERLQVLRNWEDTDAQRPRQRRGSVQMRCQCTPETVAAGLKARGLPADTGTGRGSNIPAPKIISVSLGVAERVGIRCDDCGQPSVRY